MGFSGEPQHRHVIKVAAMGNGGLILTQTFWGVLRGHLRIVCLRISPRTLDIYPWLLLPLVEVTPGGVNSLAFLGCHGGWMDSLLLVSVGIQEALAANALGCQQSRRALRGPSTLALPTRWHRWPPASPNFQSTSKVNSLERDGSFSGSFDQSPRIVTNYPPLGPMPALNNPFGQGTEIVWWDRLPSDVPANPRTAVRWRMVPQRDDERAETMSVNLSILKKWICRK